MNFLLANIFQSAWFLPTVLLVLVIGMSIMSSVSRSKMIKEHEELISSIAVGTKVKLFSGVYGTVVGMRHTTDGSLLLLESGEGDKKSYLQVHINTVEAVDKSEEVVVTADGEEVPLSELNQQKETEEVKEEVVEEKTEEVQESSETETATTEVE